MQPAQPPQGYPGFGPQPAAPPAQSGGGKMLKGCGGCGCAFALLSIIGGGVLIFFGTQPATTEAMPFGLGLTPLGVVVGIVSAILLYMGIQKAKKAG
jgi:hypothetical protein